VAENREAVAEAGFTFRNGDAADLAERLRFLIANPSVREAAGQSAKHRVREHYQWSAIATDIERVYFETMGWPKATTIQKKPNQREVPPSSTVERKTG
jgi:glycosyltransferase involved in cell wall biosynthesis